MTHVAAFLRRTPAPTVVSYAVVAAAVIAAVILLGDEIGRHVDRFEAWVDGLGPWAPVVFVPLYAVMASLFVPDTLLGIIAGASFGFTRGLLVVLAGILSASTLQYALASTWLKPMIDRMLSSRPALSSIQAAVMAQQLRLQLLIRLTPLNRAMTSYVLGAGGVRFSGFFAAIVGLVPSLCLEVYFGYAGKHFAKVVGGSEHTAVLHEVTLVVGLLVAIGVMVMVSKTARRALEAATGGRGQHPGGGLGIASPAG